MKTTSQVINTELYGKNFKLKGNDRLLAKTEFDDWFLIKRVGQRSWEAQCVAEKHLGVFGSNEKQTIHGNSSDLLDKITMKVGIKELHEIITIGQYRQAMMSIMASGEISNIIDVEITKGTN